MKSPFHKPGLCKSKRSLLTPLVVKIREALPTLLPSTSLFTRMKRGSIHASHSPRRYLPWDHQDQPQHTFNPIYVTTRSLGLPEQHCPPNSSKSSKETTTPITHTCTHTVPITRLAFFNLACMIYFSRSDKPSTLLASLSSSPGIKALWGQEFLCVFFTDLPMLLPLYRGSKNTG